MDQPDRAFEIVLARSGRTLVVPADRTILDVLIAQGVPADWHCGGGRCGTCEVRVLAGRPDHRDDVLLPSQRAAGRVMMVCVSRALDERLVLDL